MRLVLQKPKLSYYHAGNTLFQKDVPTTLLHRTEPLAQLANVPLGHSFSFNSPTTSLEFLLFLTWLFSAAIPNP